MSTNMRDDATSWLDQLKDAWERGDAEAAVQLFAATREYYERPFRPGTTMDEYREYWKDIDALQDIVFDYDIMAIDGNRCCVHWQNSFSTAESSERALLDGVFVIDFNDNGECVVFRQWWFAQK